MMLCGQLQSQDDRETKRDGSSSPTCLLLEERESYFVFFIRICLLFSFIELRLAIFQLVKWVRFGEWMQLVLVCWFLAVRIIT